MRTRMRIRAMLFGLVLLGTFSVRAVESFPQNALSSNSREAIHPGIHLEDGVHTMTEQFGNKQAFKGNFHWFRKSQVESAMQGRGRYNDPGLINADIPPRFSDSGGFLQLCLLLLFCLAVVCCASMSITPWYKVDSTFVKRCLAGVWVAFALALDMLLAKIAMSPESKLEGGLKYDGRLSGFENGRGAGQIQKGSAKKAAKGKKRRATFSGTSHHSQSSTQPIRSAEETVSIASEDSSMSTDPEVGVVPAEPEPAPEASPRVYMTPADAQIARIEAEAIERQMQRLAKQKKLAKEIPAKVVEVALETAESESSSSSAKITQPLRPNPGGFVPLGARLQFGKQDVLHKQNEHQEGSKGPTAHDRKQGTDIHVKAYARRPRDVYQRGQDHPRNGEGEHKDRFPRKPYYERNPSIAPQVLLVPRRTLFGKHKAVDLQPAEEALDRQMAPHTPDRLAVQRAGSPVSSPQSLASPSRPYADVAKENLPRPAWTSTPVIPPPPPPPPRRLSALPKSAVYAQEFTPAAQRLAVAAQHQHQQEVRYSEGDVMQPQASFQDSQYPRTYLSVPMLSRTSAPPSLEIPSLPEYSEGPLSTTSPFPGMSAHRKRAVLPVTGMYSNVLPNQLPPECGGPFSSLASRAPSSTESDPSPLYLGRPTSPWPAEPGISGILDTIWGNGGMFRNEYSSNNPWSGLGGHQEGSSNISFASSSDLGSTIAGHHDRPVLAMGHGSL